jgi:hypothetical protein
MALAIVIHDTLNVGKEIRFISIIFLAHLDTKRKDKGGLNHVIEVTRSFV